MAFPNNVNVIELNSEMKSFNNEEVSMVTWRNWPHI